mgnify:FL=1
MAVEKFDSCLNCVHLFKKEVNGMKIPADKCKAFPDGIPVDILTGGIDHHSPIEGDNGIQYERNVLIEKSIEERYEEYFTK